MRELRDLKDLTIHDVQSMSDEYTAGRRWQHHQGHLWNHEPPHLGHLLYVVPSGLEMTMVGRALWI